MTTPNTPQDHSHDSMILKGFVVVLFAISLIAMSSLQSAEMDSWTNLLLLALLTVLAAAWSVRIKSLRLELTPTDPFVLFALATAGARGALIMAVAAVTGAALWRGHRQRLRYYLFNYTAMPLSAGLASLAFHRFGGEPGMPLQVAVGPLALATAAYLLANTVSTAAAIALTERSNVVSVWAKNLRWTLWPMVISLTVTCCMLVLVESLGHWGLALALPPVLGLAAAHQVNQSRLDVPEDEPAT